ncbi:hypothetical protein ACA910_002133 [Epithemia clementina (nom. ined.)]
MQTEVALSTMEAEYIAASTSMRTLLPLRRQLLKVAHHLNLLTPQTSTISIIWEDNQAAQKLATKDPPRLTPWSKHIGIKYHWFCTHLGPTVPEMRPIGTDDQLGDIFTKPLETQLFAKARFKIMGW